MSKKAAGIVLVAVLLVCLFFVGSGVVLMLARGVEIFGIRYIGGTESKFFDKEVLGEFPGESIYIETYGVPVNINFTTQYESKVEFAQHFVGFTKSKHDKAGLEVFEDDDGNTHITSKEMVKWIYANESATDYYLNINLSVVYAMNKNLYINSKNSLITINGESYYQELNVVTGDSLVIKDYIAADKITYHAGKTINIDEKIDANSFDLASSAGSIIISKPISGDIVAKTNGGDIRFVSCRNLTAKTAGGSVKGYGEGLSTVLEKTTITTRGGDVVLGGVSTENEDARCDIKSTSGDIHITTMQDGNISSDRGKINIAKARALVVNSKVNTVSVNTVDQTIVVNGKNGNVKLGEFGSLGEVKVYTTTGKIDVKNTYGKVELKSEYSTVDLLNAGSDDVSVTAGRAVNASGLKGKVYIKANGDINVNFFGVTDDVHIITGTKTNMVNVDASTTSNLDVDYSIKSSKGKIAKVYIKDKLHIENSKIESPRNEGNHLIKIETSYAEVVLKLGE